MKSLLLAIESSCDDSSLAIIDINTFECVFEQKISQESQHACFGGVVPELAARLHAKALPDILAKTKPFLKDLVAVSATNTPGLSVSLLSGICMAKTLSMLLDIPLIGTNHLIGHVYSLFLDKKEDFSNLGVLLVSGGHTMVINMSEKNPIVLSKSLDDSFGESFDKSAKLLGFSYPGGEKIQALALKARLKNIKFTLPMLRNKSFDYSFSGLKNQVRLKVQEQPLSEELKAEIAYAFEEAATEHIIYKLKKLLQTTNFKSFGVVGGAAANLKLRFKLEALCKEYSLKLHLAPLSHCSDNALMIARAAISQYHKKDFSSFKEELLFKGNI